MYSTARRLSVFCFIFAVINIVGLIMLGLLAMGNTGIPFYILFTAAMYIITTTLILLLSTLAIRSFVQDAEIDAESSAIQVKKLTDRIAELEKKLN